MDAMGKMLSSMMGVKPEDLQNMIANFAGGLEQVGTMLKTINDKCDIMQAQLEGLINERAESGNNGHRKPGNRRSGSGCGRIADGSGAIGDNAGTGSGGSTGGSG